ncbi:MAG: endonuclease Q family protein [Desulfobulbaceae bacterium]|nr:endonuclease Q family protein [Desulfobulbaceae bacterium]
MRYIADLHIHSCYSRATAVSSHLHGLAAWAAIKGIDVIGTGDFTHPQWFQELNKYLEEAEAGFYRLKNPDEVDVSALVPPDVQPDLSGVRFVLSAEISSIYKRGGKVRKVHNILYAPDFEAVRRVSSVLAGIGNLESDGRPILGLDSRDLLEIMLDNGPDGFLVPAHIWTPWFSLFGSKSGFDTIEECFGDLSDHIFALETGLSSDPDMNRRISALDRFTLISNSDCHSPGKLGREANIFDTGFDYYSMQEAIRVPLSKDGHRRFTGTVEFFPEEGKYHCDGHRKCGICFDPLETSDYQGICPECGRPLTIGVLNRVKELADRKKPKYSDSAAEVYSLVPLAEILGEILGVGPATKKVMKVYGRLIECFGSEFNVLLNASVTDITDSCSWALGEAIERVRSGRVIRQPGYDGEFGVIKVFSSDERQGMYEQISLFGVLAVKPRARKKQMNMKSPPVIRKRNKD